MTNIAPSAVAAAIAGAMARRVADPGDSGMTLTISDDGVVIADGVEALDTVEVWASALTAAITDGAHVPPGSMRIEAYREAAALPDSVPALSTGELSRWTRLGRALSDEIVWVARLAADLEREGRAVVSATDLRNLALCSVLVMPDDAQLDHRWRTPGAEAVA
jgi:hypothetical protein